MRGTYHEPVVEVAAKGFVKEDSGQLAMGEGQGPESQVGGRVGDCSKGEFYGLNQLVYKDFGQVVVSVFAVLNKVHQVLIVFSLLLFFCKEFNSFFLRMSLFCFLFKCVFSIKLLFKS